MTLLTHLLSVDTRRYRWLIAGWIVATVATVGMQTWAPFFQSGRRGIETVDLAITFGWLTQTLLAGLLLPLIMHTHPAVGTTAFWMTRPLPPATLVRSKLLLLFTLFLGVPAICDAVMMVFYGVPTRDLWLALLEASLQRGTLVMAIASIAVLTRNLARFALALGGIVVTCAVVINAWIVLSMLRAEERADYAILTATMGDSLSMRRSFAPGSRGDLLATVVAIAAGILLISLQYRTRNTKRTIGVGLAAVGVVLAIPLAWPRPILLANPDLPTWTQDWSAARIVNLDMSVNVERGPEIGPSGWRIARGRAQMEGVPTGWLAVTRLRSAVVSTGTGVITSEAIGHAAVLNSFRRGQQETPLSTALKHHLGVDTVIWGGLYSGETLVFLSAPSQPALDREFVGSYRGEFAVDLEEMSVAAVLPVDGSSMFQSGALRVTVTGHRWFDSGVHIRYRISDLHLSQFDARPPDSYQFYLRSRSRKQAVGGLDTSGGAPYFAPRLELRGVHFPSASPFYADLREMTFSTQYFGRKDVVSVNPAWRDDAEIVIVRVRHAGTITRTLEIPQLRFVPSRP